MASDHESSDDKGEETQALPPQVTEGISKEMLAMMTFFQHQANQNYSRKQKQADLKYARAFYKQLDENLKTNSYW